MSHKIFTGVVDLGQLDDDEAKSLNREIQIALFDILDEHGIDYHTLTLKVIDGDKTLRDYELKQSMAEGQRDLEESIKDEIGGFRSSDPDTSRKGALDVYPRSGSQRWKALIAIAKSGDHGLTYAEIELKTDVNDVWKRLSELRDGGWIKESGERVVKGTGSMATIWKITPRAERHLETKERAGVLSG